MSKATNTVPLDHRWLRGHYHCTKCGGEMKCIAPLPWKSGSGVRRIGICTEDDIMIVECEHDKPKWIQL